MKIYDQLFIGVFILQDFDETFVFKKSGTLNSIFKLSQD